MNVILVTVVTYFLVMISIGVLFSRVEMSHSKFLLGEKALPGWILALSERATGASAWIMVGYTGFVFATGLSALWVSIGSAIGILFAWAFLSPIFIRVREKYNVLTLPGFLAAKYNKKARLIQSLAGLLIMVFFVFYLGAQMSGAGVTFTEIFDINLMTGIILTAVVVVAISFFGGFVSVVWTDAIQAIMMLITLIVVPIIALAQINTLDLSITTAMIEVGGGYNSITGGLSGFALGLLIFNNIAWVFGYFGGEPQLSARFMALRNKKDARIGFGTVLIWSIIVYTGTTMIGLTALTLYGQDSFTNPEAILPFMIVDLVPAWLAGLLLAGILAAIITTADSQLLVLVSAFSEDIIHKGFGIKLSDNQMVWLSRTTIVIGTIIGVLIATTAESLVYIVTSWAWAGVACTMSAAIILAFFWHRYSSAGVVATILSGLIFTIIWITTGLDEILTARFAIFFIALFFGIVTSILYPDKEENPPKESYKKTNETLNNV